MMHPAHLAAWERENVGVAWFDVVDANLVLEHTDSRIVKLNPDWLRSHGYGHHVEDAGATIRTGEHVFVRVRQLNGPFAAYEHVTG